ncbi:MULTISPECIES: hypothetical protein [Methylobacterium]|jgi:hypothetical protein|uniref:Uncharacterized protein n=1 Tax=Methylobacterium longum TaxID=767694 RepID=A0ABT8ANG0_9HYPH|nr:MULTISPECIES: hypothetical protein [Methylobacterium]MCJ2097237.1 hypothetical protein [Methylobacterium sp. E-046]MDN3571432.1 hypothetical protein [Methylobacterium longum]GJE14919.1 hypothetical protein FOHLNKBM_5996 [Methylobacterium longum]
MKSVFAIATVLALLSAVPASAMSCCRGKGKAGMMCGKAGMAMNHAKAGKAGGCCCDGMGGANMSRRT